MLVDLLITAFLIALLACVVLSVTDRRRVARTRFTAPGSLPRARGFEAAAHRHFGNPGPVVVPLQHRRHVGEDLSPSARVFTPWAAARDKARGLVERDAIPLYPECP